MRTTKADGLRSALACCALALASLPAASAADGKPLALDLHLPPGIRHPPLLIFVHGGAWTTGNKTQYPTFLMQRGFAVASLDFRPSNDAAFPADVFDIKAGIPGSQSSGPPRAVTWRHWSA